jgi:predicted molibdopterin-dependent oxidoreductase YjgC
VPDKQVDSVCPYCGVGCQLTYNVKDNKILYVEGRDGPANHNACASRAATASITRTIRIALPGR